MSKGRFTVIKKESGEWGSTEIDVKAGEGCCDAKVRMMGDRGVCYHGAFGVPANEEECKFAIAQVLSRREGGMSLNEAIADYRDSPGGCVGEDWDEVDDVIDGFLN